MAASMLRVRNLGHEGFSNRGVGFRAYGLGFRFRDKTGA